MGGGRSNRSSSSGEEDGDADWKAAIDSLATTTSFAGSATETTAPPNGRNSASNEGEDENQRPSNIKHYQIKAQKLLNDILEKTIVVVKDAANIPENDIRQNEGGGIRLFKSAPPGIVMDRVDEFQGPKRKPRIILGEEEMDEKSKKFRKQLKSVAVDGADIIAAAKASCQKSLSRLEAREAAAKAAAKREEERVAELKKVRGERWLLSMARDRKVNGQC